MAFNNSRNRNLDLLMNGELSSFSPEKQLERILSDPSYDLVETAFKRGRVNE